MSLVSGSVSFANILILLSGVLNGVLARSALAVGTSLVPLMVMVTVVGVPSNASTVMVSVNCSVAPKACTEGRLLLRL